VINEVTAYSVLKMMQGVLQFGTGANIWSFDLPGGMEMAGKTGTTNDNADAWFIGYTPQLLAGGWVGADDRIIRFNTESKNGEGGRQAMPVWAYFMKKAAEDPNCGIDTKLTFVKPEGMTNDIDLNNLNNVPVSNGEVDESGTGKSGDYDVPKDIKMEDIIGPESDVPVTTGDNKDNGNTNNGKGNNKNPKKTPANPNPANLPGDKKGRAVMPPPVKKPKINSADSL